MTLQQSITDTPEDCPGCGSDQIEPTTLATATVPAWKCGCGMTWAHTTGPALTRCGCGCGFTTAGTWTP